MNTDNNVSDIEGELEKLGYWNKLFTKDDYFGTGHTILADLAKNVIEKNSINNVLELGCGQGRDSVFFAKLGCNVVALDISQNAINSVEKIKKEQGLQNLQLFTHDIQESLNFQDMTFQLIYSNLALQFFNLDELKKIFLNIYNIMADKSFFLFSTKKAGDKYFDFGNKISDNAFEYKGIKRFFFSKSEIESLLEPNFSIILFDDDKHVNPDKTTSVWWKILVQKN